MPYLIETFDKPDHVALRTKLRPAHLDYLATVAPKLIACGAKLSDDGETADGGIYLVDVDTREEAEALIAADPFARGGLFDRVHVQRWRKAYVDGRSFL
ncbi:YciI family protein [Microbacterium sediminis]|uniref:Uncharacterized protein n=1 Tax=Microbacterium sediminis TaxID=904291 RepID=A0A1B9NDH4_9MICO|nr:YciI family protein [Microbacterium sediminis]OCG74638.1 hypothetical protein A7J15_03660 [Microbacterium sediminis]QBR74934.1 YciI family protein [Microbacterium sediminis]